MKQLVLMASLAMQLTVAFAAQPRFPDESFAVEDRPQWYCFLTVAGSEQNQQEPEKTEQQTEEEPDCE